MPALTLSMPMASDGKRYADSHLVRITHQGGETAETVDQQLVDMGDMIQRDRCSNFDIIMTHPCVGPPLTHLLTHF